MKRTEVVEQLHKYFVSQVLDGKNIGLDETTPLLEWGVINSIEVVRLLNFINQQFEMDLPTHQIIADNLTDIGTIADMVLRNQAAMAVSSSDGIR